MVFINQCVPLILQRIYERIRVLLVAHGLGQFIVEFLDDDRQLGPFGFKLAVFLAHLGSRVLMLLQLAFELIQVFIVVVCAVRDDRFVVVVLVCDFDLLIIDSFQKIIFC